MAFLVRATFEDGSTKIIRYADSYDAALTCMLTIADRREAYAEPLPLLKTVQLIAGDRVEFDMRVERYDRIGPPLHGAGRTGMAGIGASAGSSASDLGRALSKAIEAHPGKFVRMSAYSRPLSALDMLTRWEPSRSDEAGFHSGLDNAARTVRVMGSGIWRDHHAELYFDQQKRIVDQARRRFGPLKIMFDVRNWVVENPQSALQFQNVNEELYHPDDRLVAIVRSASDKPHPKTALRGENTEVFTSRNAAELWLHASPNSG